MADKQSLVVPFGRFSGFTRTLASGSVFALMKHPTEPQTLIPFDLKDLYDYRFLTEDTPHVQQYEHAIKALTIIS